MVTYNAIEPPEWSLYINLTIPGWKGSYGIDAKHGYFTAPSLRKKTVEPGIDVYNGEYFIVYDPSRPAYWIPVTVNEAFQAVREFWTDSLIILGRKWLLNGSTRSMPQYPGRKR